MGGIAVAQGVDMGLLGNTGLSTGAGTNPLYGAGSQVFFWALAGEEPISGMVELPILA
jgi:hypothetical protein